MKLYQIASLCILLSAYQTVKGQDIIPFSDKRWEIKAQGQLQEYYQGNNSLYLQNGIAYLPTESFTNGIIEFDIYMLPRTSFSGLIFRVTDPNNYEELYLRSHLSGFPDAYQYTPVYNNDPAWQLYHDQHDVIANGLNSYRPKTALAGYNTVASFPFDRWLHVKFLVRGTEAELYLDGQEKPVAFIRQLLMGEHAGGVGVKSGAGAVWFSNFSLTKTNDVKFKTLQSETKVESVPGTIKNWEISNALSEQRINKVTRFTDEWLKGMKWQTFTAPGTGIINLAQFSAVSDSTNTLLARFTVHADQDEIRKLDIGYSDKARVYCNGTILFSGNTTFRSRDYRYLGTIGYFESVYLPLKKGDNIITVAVSETFGGWGVMAKFD